MEIKNKSKNNKNNDKNSKFSCFLKKISTFFEKYLFPEDIKCIFCGKDISHFYEQPYCNSCKKLLHFNNSHRCKICDEPIQNEATICDNCQRNKRSFQKIYCPLIYQGILRSSLISYKNDNKRYLAKGYAKIIYDYIGENFKHFDFITFVPITKERLKERSFNQSKQIALKLGELTNLPVIDCLEKIKETRPQKKLNYKERSENLKGSFRLIKKDEIKNKNCLLVDDIITTCATVDECSKILKQQVRNVYVTAVARNKIKIN